MARLSVCEQRTRSRHHIERGRVGGEGGGRQSERSRSETILGKPRVAMWLWTERCSTQILNYSLDLRRYHHAACSRRITCGMRRMTRAVRHLTRQRWVRHQNREKLDFSTRRRRRRQTRYNRIGAECAECTRACDEYFGRNTRIVDSSTGASGRTERAHLGLRRTELFGLQRHCRLMAERIRSQTRSASRAACP